MGALWSFPACGQAGMGLPFHPKVPRSKGVGPLRLLTMACFLDIDLRKVKNPIHYRQILRNPEKQFKPDVVAEVSKPPITPSAAFKMLLPVTISATKPPYW